MREQLTGGALNATQEKLTAAVPLWRGNFRCRAT